MNDFVTPERKLQVVTTCRAYDLPMLELALPRLQQFLPFKNLSVIAPNRDCEIIRRRLGATVEIIPEDGFLPGMNLRELQALPRFDFPKNAGWYFQQFLKLQFAFTAPEDDYYLIWDADTIPLRPLSFFDADGRMLLTQAEEFHAPYFETYRRLFHAEPHREFSCIAQHMLVQKSVARAMLATIAQRADSREPWPWIVMRSLPALEDFHLFSEFETYGHYLKNNHPERVAFVARRWRRWFDVDPGGGKIPTERDLKKLARDYDYVCFEKARSGWRYWAKLFAKEFLQRR